MFMTLLENCWWHKHIFVYLASGHSILKMLRCQVSEYAEYLMRQITAHPLSVASLKQGDYPLLV